MPEIRSVDDIIRRGQAAEALLNNSLLSEALESVLSRIALQWLASKREADIDVREREELHAKANAVKELRGQLKNWVNDAIAEAARIQRADKRQGVK